MINSNFHIGGTFDGFLSEQGILEDCEDGAIKQILAAQVAETTISIASFYNPIDLTPQDLPEARAQVTINSLIFTAKFFIQNN